MKKTFLLKTMLLLCALVVGSSAWAETVTLAYTTNSTTNMSGDNDATTVGLSASAWSVVGSKGSATNFPGLNKAGQIRLYYNSEGSNYITVSSLTGGTINSIKVTYGTETKSGTTTHYNGGVVKVGNTTISDTNDNTDIGQYAISSSSFTIENGNSSNVQVWIVSIEINYTPGSGVYVDKPSFSPTAGEVTSGTQVTLTQNDAEYIIYTTDGTDPTWEPLNGTEYTAPIVINAVTTIKAIAVDADENVSAIATAKYTLPKVAAGISFATESYNVSLDDYASFTGQTLTNPHNLAVTYSVTNTNVASVNSVGVVTLKGVKGETTVKATFAGNDEYLAGTVSYKIIVYNPNEVTFDFESKNNAYGSGVTTTSDGNTYITDDKNWTNGVITLTTSGKYRWWDNDGTLRFYSNNPQSKIVINATDGYVLTEIAITGGQQFSSNDGSYSSSTGKWTGTAKSLTLTYNKSSGSIDVKKITVAYSDKVKATVQSYGWASFIAPAPVQFAANTAYVVTDASLDDGLTLAAVTTVPAGTPLLLKGAGEKTATVIASADAPTTNLLSVCNGTIDDGNYAYVLAKDGEGACFKQWTGDSSVLNGRVVLILSASTRSTYELGEEMTGVQSVVREAINDNQYYNLSGQRVDNPTKGLYIVNGKKVVIK